MFKNPNAVFIHIPKNAGTSIRALWEGDNQLRTFGHIPQLWRDAPSFAIVRNPEARFLSAIRMFKFGNPDYDDYYKEPAWPLLSIDMALGVLENDDIPFDGSQKYRESNFKHHIIAQTHPYNCLAQADYVLRQENLTEDFEKIRSVFGFSGPLEHIRNTRDKTKELVPTDAQRQRIYRAFSEDYKQLGYIPGKKEYGGMAIEKSTEPNIWQSWPVFFSSKNCSQSCYNEALPHDDVDLNLFADDLIKGHRKTTWPGRFKDANKHFHGLLHEFVGKPRICHLLACTIVIIRKTKGAGPGLILFNRILDEHLDLICDTLNSRWLTAVCDTLADHGRDAVQRSLGLCGAILSNIIKLSETERIVFMPQRPWPPNVKVRREAQLFDGVIGFATDRGDLIFNMLTRINNSVDNDLVAGGILAEISIRMLTHDTVLRRFTSIAGHEPIPVLNTEIRKELEALTHKEL